MFYCREKELAQLEKRYAGDAFECIVLYGRRRVGKTSLMNVFCEGKPTIYFSALDTTAEENLKTLSAAIYAYQTPTGGRAPSYQSYDDAFAAITQLGQNQRLVFVIDEYPYLANADKSISSRLQHLIDHAWGSSNIFLFLCGSSMSFMEKQVLGYQSPLYGRRTAQFKITPLTYRDAAAFHSGLSAEENALIYGMTGGVPHYINKLKAGKDIDAAVLENILEPSAYLFEEPANLLKQELREPAVYNAIITAIAGGASRLNEIATKTGLESAVCAKYLKNLIELDILCKETPFAQDTGKKSLYQVKDNFFRFWYRFVPRNITLIASGKMGRYYDTLIKPEFSHYMGLVFETMCKDYLRYYAVGLPVDCTEVGQWWGTDPSTRKQAQIDIVASCIAPGQYLIGSCKYKNQPIGADELALLEQYAKAFGKGSSYHYIIFSKGGFSEGLQAQGKRADVTLLTLEDIYKK